MMTAQQVRTSEFNLQSVEVGKLHELKAGLFVRQSSEKPAVVDDLTLVSMCQKIRPESWRKIPVLFDRQIASVFWKATEDSQALCENIAFAEWFITDRVQQETVVSQAFINSLLSEWPDEITGFSELLQYVETVLPKGISWPDSDWQQDAVYKVFEGRTTVSIAVNSLGDGSGFRDAIQKLLWKQLIKQYSTVALDQAESKYFGLKAIVETGFVNGREKWPELNVDYLNQLTLSVDIQDNHSSAFHDLAVSMFDRLDTQQKRRLEPFVLSTLDAWSINKFADKFDQFSKVDPKVRKLQYEKLQAAARAGHVRGNKLAGQQLLKSPPGSADWQRGIKCLITAANGQDYEAQSLLCDLHQKGQATMLANDDVVKWRANAFAQGDSRLFNQVLESAKEGNPASQFGMAIHCLNRDELHEGVEWLGKASAQNHQVAMSKMAAMLMSGDRIAVNREEALRLYKKLVIFSDVEAVHHLALFYRLGINMPENLELAISLYRKAACQGSAVAAFILGSFYVAGAVLPKSPQLARHFLCKAAIAGHVEAGKLLSELAASDGAEA